MVGTRVTGGGSSSCINRHSINHPACFAVSEVVPSDVKGWVGIAISAAGVAYVGSDVALVNGQRAIGKASQVIVVIAKTAQRNGMSCTRTTGRCGRSGINRYRINHRTVLTVSKVIPSDARPAKRRVGIAIGAAGIIDAGGDIALVDGQRTAGRTCQVIVVIAKAGQGDVVASARIGIDVGGRGTDRCGINDRSGFTVGKVAPNHISPCKGRVGIAIGTAGIVHSGGDVALGDRQGAIIGCG